MVNASETRKAIPTLSGLTGLKRCQCSLARQPLVYYLQSISGCADLKSILRCRETKGPHATNCITENKIHGEVL
jgi:hypothetical protein